MGFITIVGWENLKHNNLVNIQHQLCYDDNYYNTPTKNGFSNITILNLYSMIAHKQQAVDNVK